MADWIEIGRVEDIPKPGSRLVETGKGPIAVFRGTDDAIFALHNRCPHRGGPLSEGLVHGHKVTCPLHNWVIELENGEAVAPDVGCAAPVPVRVADGRIWIEIGMRLEVAHG
ncbi:nitrite reductase small subunit NirD [Telmatospirillum siberiense]|uniref:Nitrite reductase (NAD(P)H) small subunit n=1 Tax=Telmatospirillum siberiense TaxID=382514 RepID=A0A2N3PMT0_9PROT|nr:nitrite reductase small subunit NirD [Telmatospirillum siberiense]PKU21707.1 nitrite reductase (NAD(P)H) small subunit [Telmatospirillum siberiense]